MPTLPFTFTSPFQKPIKYDPGVRTGFILHPHTEANPEGWGEPFKDGEGNPIEPGTEGGSNSNVFVGKTGSGDWRRARSPAYQLAGNIDWKGPLNVAGDTTSGRVTLSYHGPQQRYWNAQGAFQYEGNSSHRRVYSAGRLIAVAPYPVLGASLTTREEYIPAQGDYGDVTYINVICKRGLEDVAYTRPMGAFVKSEEITGDLLADLEALADAQDNPDGWVEMGSFVPEGSASIVYYPQDTPWFFSEDGTEARAMRRCAYTFDDQGGTNLTEDLWGEMKVRLVHKHKVAAFEEIGFDLYDYISYYEQFYRFLTPQYTDPQGHLWDEDHVQIDQSIIGQIKVAVDYPLGSNSPTYAWIDIQAVRGTYQDFSTGADDPGAPDSNDGDRTGPPIPQGVTPVPGGHYALVWFGVQEFQWLGIGTDKENLDHTFLVGYGRTGDSNAFTGGGDPETSELHYWVTYTLFPRYFDIRETLLVGRMKGTLMTFGEASAHWGTYEMSTSNLYETLEDIEWWGRIENDDDPLNSPDGILNRWTSDKTVADTGEVIGWGPYTEQDTWPAPSTWLVPNDYDFVAFSRLTYANIWNTDNDDESEYEPGILSFYNSSYINNADPNHFRLRPIPDLLRHADCLAEDSVFGTDSAATPNSLIHYIYQDPNTETDKVSSALSNDGPALADVIGYGDRFWSGGPV